MERQGICKSSHSLPLGNGIKNILLISAGLRIFCCGVRKLILNVNLVEALR